MFKPFKGVRKAEHVVDHILAAIRRGELEPGARLPDENAMAAEFTVSRNCVREALRILETMGVVEVRHGRGCFLTGSGDQSQPPRMWLSWLRAFQTEVLELLEVREAVEVKAAQLAARFAEPADIEELEALADRMVEQAKKNEGGTETMAQLDRDFHTAVAKASRNSFLLKLAPSSWGADDRQATFVMEGRGLLSARQHQEVCAAIATHDPEAAGQAMSRHINDVIQQVRALKDRSQPDGTVPKVEG